MTIKPIITLALAAMTLGAAAQTVSAGKGGITTEMLQQIKKANKTTPQTAHCATPWPAQASTSLPPMPTMSMHTTHTSATRCRAKALPTKRARDAAGCSLAST